MESLKAKAWDIVVQINQLQAQIQQLNQSLLQIQEEMKAKNSSDGAK